MDFPKAFDTINYDLLIAKFDIYGFGKNALSLIYVYWKSKKQRIKINNTIIDKNATLTDQIITANPFNKYFSTIALDFQSPI